MIRNLFCCAALLLPVAASAQVDHSNHPIRPGNWFYAPTSTGSEARFTDAGGQAVVTIRCTRAARRVAIAVRSAVAVPSIVLWTSSASRTLATAHNPATGLLTVELPAGDAMLDALAFSRGRFSVTVQGVALIIPNWPEPTRAIEDCRN